MSDKKQDIDEQLMDAHGEGYEAGQQDLYTWMSGTVEEWHALQIVNDSQMLWLKELLHEVEKIVYYDFKGENDDL